MAEERRILARTLSVSAVGIGTAALAVPYGPPGAERPAPDAAAATQTLRNAFASGIDFVDTAPGYGNAESLVANASDGFDTVVATKVVATDPAEVRASADRSRARLRRTRLDLLQVHNADTALIEDGRVPQALARLRSEGVVTLTGATVYDEQDALAAISCGHFDCVQIAYSALDRRPERRVFSAADSAGVSVIARSVLLRGVLSPAARDLAGPFAPLRDAADRFRRSVGAEWEELPGAALAFVLSRPEVAAVIIGPRDADELRDLLETAERFAGIEHADDPRLPDELVDPRLWPAEARHG